MRTGRPRKKNMLEKDEAVSEWLKDFKGRTAYAYEERLNKFFSDTGKTSQDLERMTAKEIHKFLVEYQVQQQTQKVKQNSILSVITAVRSFCTSLDKPIRFRKNQLDRGETDTESHVFTNGDLRGLFEVGNTTEKAIMATATSLGWEISAFLSLKWAKIQGLIEHAKANGEPYVFYEDKRDKTSVPRLCVLNPLAIEWLTKYMEITKDSHGETLFDYTSDGIEKMLNRLANQSGMKRTGPIRFHRIRAWLMSRLSRAGFNEFECKFIIGHAIPIQDRAYLLTLKNDVEDKYPRVYEDYLNIYPQETAKAKEKDAIIKDLQTRIAKTEEKLENIERLVQDLKKEAA